MWEKLMILLKFFPVDWMIERRSDSVLNIRPYANYSMIMVATLIFLLILSGTSWSQAVYTDTVTVRPDTTLAIRWLKLSPSTPIVRSYKLYFVELPLMDATTVPMTEWHSWPYDVNYVYVEYTVSLSNYGDYEVYLTALNQAGESGGSNKILLHFIEGEKPDDPREFSFIVIKKAQP